MKTAATAISAVVLCTSMFVGPVASIRAFGSPLASSSTAPHHSTSGESPAARAVVSVTNQTKVPKISESFNRMVNSYNRSIHLSPAAVACFNRGYEFSIRGAAKNALREYNRAAELAPRYASAYAGRGLAKGLLGDKDGAAADYRLAIKLNPRYAPAYQNLGTLKDEAGDIAGAINDYTICIHLMPECTDAYCNRAAALCLIGDKQSALKDCNRALEIDRNCVLAYCTRGDVLVDLDEGVTAVDDYTRAIKIDPSCAYALTGRGNYRFSQFQFKSALDDYTRVVKLEPKSADAYFQRGVAWVRMNGIHQAMDDFTRCLQLDPKYSAAYIERGWLWGHRDKSRYSAAINDFSNAITLDPSSPRAREGRAFARYFVPDIPGAIADYTVLLGMKHSNWEALSAHEMRGAMYLQLKNYPAAIDDFSQYLKLDSKNAYCYILRASALYHSGNKVDAFKDWSTAVSLSPTDSTTYNQAVEDITDVDVRKLFTKLYSKRK
jgi:tetratricopeptide (TPR) repeat protein